MNLEDFARLIGVSAVYLSYETFPNIFYRQKLVRPIVIATVILAVIGLILSIGLDDGREDYLMLIWPVFTLLGLQKLLSQFKKKYGRYPKELSRSKVIRQVFDNLFHAAVFLFTFLLPLISWLILHSLYSA